ncbi:MAG: type II secretion system F family protein [Chthoniobacterales bacterium]|nr:type II secretion system F family protein [Chthoniobacterales bacterium]
MIVQLRFKDKEHFFHDVAQMLRSGLPLQSALENLALGRDRTASAARRVAPGITTGLDAALQEGGFSIVDREILAAGEQSGRLEEACRELAGYYSYLESGRKRAVAASLYPLFLLHLAALLLSVPSAIIAGSFLKFLGQVGVFLGAAYLAAFLVALAYGILARSFRSSPAADRLIRGIPILGGCLWDAALSRFCLVLSLGIRSADGVLASLRRAGRASKSAAIEAAAESAVSEIRSGTGFADALAASRAFPMDLERAFRVAEASGRLDEEITRWAGIYRDRFHARIETLTEWLPRIFYLLIVALVVARMFSMISQITGIYSSVLEM